MNINETNPRIREMLDPKSKKFNHTALAQWNEDQVKNNIKRSREFQAERMDRERLRQRIVKTDRHQVADRYIQDVRWGRVDASKTRLGEVMDSYGLRKKG